MAGRRWVTWLASGLACAVVFAALPVSSVVPAQWAASAQAAAQKYTICHRTHSTTNPYRRITVSQSAVTRTNGHKEHAGYAAFDPTVTYPANAKNWGDIYPNPGNGENYGTSNAGLQRGKDIFDGLGSYAGLCQTMSAKQFYDVEVQAGVAPSSILADLETQAASEDLALKATLPGGTFVGADPTALSAVAATTRAASSVTAAVQGQTTTYSATLNGTLKVGSTSTTGSFLWGTTNPPSTPVTASPSPVTDTTDIAATLSGLSKNTTYYFQAVGTYTLTDATNTSVDGSIVGEVLSFTTPDPAKSNQTITFTVPGDTTYGVDPITLVAPSATSDLPVAIASASPEVCTVSGLTVTVVGVGTCVLDANQAGNLSYNPAPTVERTFVVGKGTQSITFGSISSKLTSDAAFTVSPSASSGLAVTLTSGTTSVCTVAETTITLTGTRGTCTIHADQAGNARYSAASRVSQSFAVNANQTITFAALSSKAVGFATFTVASSASSGLAVVLASDTPAVCTVNGFEVSSVTGATGTCSLTATQAGDGSQFYNAAPSVTRTFTVSAVTKQTRTITVAAGSTSLTYGGSTTVSSQADHDDSDGMKTYSVKTGLDKCEIAGTKLTAIGVGTCTIEVSIGEGSNYDAATSTNLVTVTVERASRTIAVAASPTSIAVGGTSDLTSTPTAGGGVRTYRISSSDGGCTLTGAVVTGAAEGSCTVEVIIAEDNQYLSATSTNTVTITVGLTARTITVSATPTSIVVGSTSALASVASVGTGTKTYRVTGGATYCSVSGTTLTGDAAGACTVEVTIASDGTYGAATSTNSVTVTVTASAGGGGNSGNSGYGGANSGGGSTTTTAPQSTTPAAPGNSGNSNKKIKAPTPTVVVPAMTTPTGGSTPPTGGSTQPTGPGSSNAGGNATAPAAGNGNNSPAKVNPLPKAEVPLTTADDAPVEVTKVKVDGPAKPKINDDGSLELMVPIGYKGKVTVDVTGVPKGRCASETGQANSVGTAVPGQRDNCANEVQERVELQVEGPQPTVVPNAAAAERPRLVPVKPGQVSVVGLDKEVSVSWSADPNAVSYDVYEGKKLACMTVYSTCVLPARNGQINDYRVEAVNERGVSTPIAEGEGKAVKKGTLITTVYFDSADDSLNAKAKTKLNKLINDLLAMGLRQVALVGHTDTRGSVSYNRELSKDRADNVESFLDSRLIDAIVTDKTVLGETQLAVPEEESHGDWRNRRVEIRVH